MKKRKYNDDDVLLQLPTFYSPQKHVIINKKERIKYAKKTKTFKEEEDVLDDDDDRDTITRLCVKNPVRKNVVDGTKMMVCY